MQSSLSRLDFIVGENPLSVKRNCVRMPEIIYHEAPLQTDRSVIPTSPGLIQSDSGCWMLESRQIK